MVYDEDDPENLEWEGAISLRISDGVKKLIKDRGLRQTWIVDQMNRIMPELNMSKTKFSAIVCGGRKMTGDELMVFCLATGTSPDYFYNA